MVPNLPRRAPGPHTQPRRPRERPKRIPRWSQEGLERTTTAPKKAPQGYNVRPRLQTANMIPRRPHDDFRRPPRGSHNEISAKAYSGWLLSSCSRPSPWPLPNSFPHRFSPSPPHPPPTSRSSSLAGFNLNLKSHKGRGLIDDPPLIDDDLQDGSKRAPTPPPSHDPKTHPRGLRSVYSKLP